MAPSFLNTSSSVLLVICPVSEFLILTVIDLMMSSPRLLYTVVSPTFSTDLIVVSFGFWYPVASKEMRFPDINSGLLLIISASK